MFRKTLFSVLFFTTLQSFAAPVEKAYIISGFDDVLRQAENTGLVKAAIKVLQPDEGFTGMPELYSVVSSDEQSPRFALVSATSTFFFNRFNGFLNRTDFPTRHVYFRNWLTERSIEDFKISRIQNIIAGHPGRKFIVIFDNSDPSLSMSDTLRSTYADSVAVVYLRQVIEKPMPASSRPFFTAFDIALNEYREGRLGDADVQTVADAILKETQATNLFPSYAICPQNYDPCQNNDGEMTGTCAAVRTHVRELCR